MFARIPQWLLKSLQKVCIIIMYAPWCGIIRPPGCLAHGLVWAIEHCVRWGVRIPPGEGASRLGVGFPIVKYRRSAPRRVLFDGKFHQAVAGWTVNLSGFIQTCLSLSHVVVGLTVRILLWTICYEVVYLSVCVSVTRGVGRGGQGVLPPNGTQKFCAQ